MTSTGVEVSTTLLLAIVSPAIRALVIGCAAGLGLAAFRVKATSVRLFSWTTVLYIALAMPFLGWILPPLNISTPGFLQQFSQSAAVQQAPQKPHGAQPRKVASNFSGDIFRKNRFSQNTSTIELIPSSFSSSSFLSSLFAWSRSHWSLIAAAAYVTVSLLLLSRFFVGLAFVGRLMRASQRIDEPCLTRKLAARGRASGLALTPQAAESGMISVPVTAGALHSTILLPAIWREWDEAKLDAVIAHEMSHVARRDALTQQLSLLHRAIFWFSPLAWWLHKHLADLAEQASDEAALSCGIDRKDYARTLLGFFEALQAAPSRVWWPGVSMAKAGQAEQRVERILCWRGSVAMNLKKSVAFAVVVFAVPVVYLAASARPTSSYAVVQDERLAENPVSGQIARPALLPQVAPNAKPNPAVAPAAVATEPMTPSAPVVAPVPVAAVATGTSPSEAGYSYSYGFNDDDERFVIVTGKSDSLTMSGSMGDAKHVEKLRKSIPGDFIWFQSDEKSYIIRDQATIDRARKLWAPQEELGKKQEELGKQQEALGKQQEELGKKQEEIQVNVPDMTAELDKLKAELKRLGPSATADQISDIQSEIGDLQSKIGELQSEAGERQSKLGEEQGVLGEQQGKLGEQQGELGRQQAELAQKAAHEMKLLLEEAVKKGIAQPEL
ncbi:MAG TPA: M56 family metallopeptidase [Candidatus Sulfotelmatobacter sp.]